MTPVPVGPADGQIFMATGNGTVYLREGNVKRRFAGATAFSCRGFDWGAIEAVDPAVAARLDEGPPLEPPPYCVLHNRTFKGDSDDLVLIMRNGIAYPVIAAEHFECWGFEWPRVKFVQQRHLDGGEIRRGTALSFPADCLRNGTFVLDGETWYEMSDGFLRKIGDPVTLACRQARPGPHPLLRRTLRGLEPRLGPQLPYRQACDAPSDRSVIVNQDTGDYFLIEMGKKRHIPSPECRTIPMEVLRAARWLRDGDVDDYFSANPGYLGPPVSC